MITFLFAAFVAAGVAVARGGSLKSLADTQFRWLWLLFAGLAIQLGAQIWAPAWLDGWAGTAVIVGSNAIVLVFLVANREKPGIPLIVAGLALNVIVIAANGAMPVSVAASRSAGVPAPPLGRSDIEHERLGDDTKLPWLADVLAIPHLQQVFSFGDVVLGLGVADLVYRRASSGKARRTSPDENPGVA